MSIERAQDMFIDLFTKADIDGDGRLTADEFKEMLYKAGYTYSDVDIKVSTSNSISTCIWTLHVHKYIQRKIQNTHRSPHTQTT